MSKHRKAFMGTWEYHVSRVELETSFQTSQAMNIRVKEMPTFQVAYIRYIGPYGAEGTQNTLRQLRHWAQPRELYTPGKVIGISWDNPDVTPEDKCRYDVGIIVPKGGALEGEIPVQTLLAGRYAVYHCEVPENDVERPWNELLGGMVSEQRICAG